MRLVSIALVLLLAGACGKDDSKPKPPPAKAEELPPLTVPPLGVDAIKKMNYVYGDGAKAYEKVREAFKKKDWPAVAATAKEVLAKDAGHLDAHRMLGSALAQTGDFPGAAEHLLAALAGDFVRWGEKLPGDPDLKDFLVSPHGKALLAKHLEMKAAVETAIDRGVWLLGRRSTYKWPAKTGPSTTRGELYAFDEATRRFFRISHTDHQLAAWLLSPDGQQIALVGYDRAELPAATAKNAAPKLRGWVETIDARTFEQVTQRASFKSVRALGVSWGAGGQLLVETFDGAGRWALTPKATFTVDPSTGKTAKTTATTDPGSGRVLLTLDEALVSPPQRGLKLTPSPTDPSLISELTIESSGRTISLPESGLGDASVPRANPSGSRAAFATWVDPCGEEDAAKPSLYVADAKTGQTKHLLTTDSRFNLRWLGDDKLVYEDGKGGLRIWDATTGREAMKILEKGSSLGLNGLSPTAEPICRKEPLEGIETETVPEEPMPPEEGPGEPAPPPPAEPDDGAGPVTTP
jgi:hypothetical protein